MTFDNELTGDREARKWCKYLLLLEGRTEGWIYSFLADSLTKPRPLFTDGKQTTETNQDAGYFSF